MLSLALAYLRDRSLTTLLNVVLLALAVATLAILLLFSTQLTDRLQRDAQGIDLVVGAKGSPLQLILSSIYQIDAPTGNIPLDSVALLRRDPAVARVVPLAMGDSFRGYRIVGTDATYLQLYDAGLAEGRMFAKSGDAVLGATVARTLGANVGQRFVGSHGFGSGEGVTGHDEHPFTTVGILAPTGTVVDRLVLTPIESVWDVHGIGHDHHEGDAEHGDEAAHTQGEGHEHEAEEHEAELIGAAGTSARPSDTSSTHRILYIMAHHSSCKRKLGSAILDGVNPILQQRPFDGLAIGASTLCLIHCIAVPVIIVLAPALAALLAMPESFHLWALGFAVPTSVIALHLGYQRHRHGAPAIFATLGIALLALGTFAAQSEGMEVLLSVAGALILATGHGFNWRAMRL